MAGNHTYWIPEPNSWESRSDNKADKIIDSLDATAALHLAQRAMAAEEQKAAAEQFQLDQKTFLKMYPVYKDTDRNAQLMRHHWENALGVTVPSLTDIEASFFALRESGVLQPDAKAVAREDEEKVIRRVAPSCVRHERREHSMRTMRIHCPLKSWSAVLVQAGKHEPFMFDRSPRAHNYGHSASSA